MSNLSIGDVPVSNSKKEVQSRPIGDRNKPNMMDEKAKSLEDMSNISLDEEIRDILNDKRVSSSPQVSPKEFQGHEVGPLDKIHGQMSKIVMGFEEENANQTVSNSQSPDPLDFNLKDQSDKLNKSSLIPVPSEAKLESKQDEEEIESSKISAYARLDFENFTFFVQTLQVVLGRKSNDELLQSSHHSVDVHLSSKKAISRRHAKIFYNFGTQRFELSISGRNGAFVDDLFVEKGMTVPLVDGTKIQIGDIPFVFVLPSIGPNENDAYNASSLKPFNPSDAVNLRSNLYNSKSPTPKNKRERSAKKGAADDISSQIDPSLKDIQRKPSISRKKSIAGDEDFEVILKEFDKNQAEGDSELIDSQIEIILGNNIEESNLMKLAQFNESTIDEGDEIDKLVQQHNLDQGSSVEDDELENIDISLSVLDQEIATLAPLIDAHHQDLMKEKEEKRKRLEEEKKKKQLKKSYAKGAAQQLTRSTPLMGKPAVPRMGRLASIQPPSSRLYGRQLNGLTKTQIIDNRLTTTTLTGLPTHLVGSSGLALNLSQGIPMSKPLMPPRPPPPKLEASINVIMISPPKKTRFPAITVNYNIDLTSICKPKFTEEFSTFPKLPRKRKEPKKPNKNLYTLDEIPEQYRTKPTLSYPIMITNVLKSKNAELGLTIHEINDAIKEIYPYYKYCPDGWQYSISHNVKLNKIFKKSIKRDNEITWIIDDSFMNEREIVRKKQQEIAAAKAKAAAIKAEELKQKQRLEVQQAISNNIVGRNFVSPYGSNLRIPQTQFISQLQQKQATGQKPKTIAELASEIRRDGLIGSKAPLYFKPQSTLQVNSSGELVKRNDFPASISGTSSLPVNIKAQLAANRSQTPSQTPSPATPHQQNSHSPPPSMNHDTKKSLAYLQKELFTLYKARKLSYNTATTTEIITKALATTIAQVNVIGAKAGCGDNALSFLVEKAPQQVSKILDIALTKSIKEKQGNLSSRSPSRASTPAPVTVEGYTKSPSESESKVSTTNTANSRAFELSKSITPVKLNSAATSTLARPPSFDSSKGTTKSESPSLSRPPNFTSSLLKPQSFSKPGGLSRPPQFLSNKQRTDIPESSSTLNERSSKRELSNDNDQKNEESPKKIIKIE